MNCAVCPVCGHCEPTDDTDQTASWNRMLDHFLDHNVPQSSILFPERGDKADCPLCRRPMVLVHHFRDEPTVSEHVRPPDAEAGEDAPRVLSLCAASGLTRTEADDLTWTTEQTKRPGVYVRPHP